VELNVVPLASAIPSFFGAENETAGMRFDAPKLLLYVLKREFGLPSQGQGIASGSMSARRALRSTLECARKVPKSPGSNMKFLVIAQVH
jgi:hypothetical protein